MRFQNMIYQGSKIRVIDNSGALTALCIKVLRKNPRCPANHGNILIAVVKSAVAGKRVTKSQIHRALLVWSPTNQRRAEGTYLRMVKGACVLLKKDGQPLANKVRGPVYRELRVLGHSRIISIAKKAL